MFQNHSLPVIFRSIKYAVETTLLLLLLKLPTFGDSHTKNTHEHNTIRIKSPLYTSRGQRGKEAHWFFPCFPFKLSPCLRMPSYHVVI